MKTAIALVAVVLAAVAVAGFVHEGSWLRSPRARLERQLARDGGMARLWPGQDQRPGLVGVRFGTAALKTTWVYLKCKSDREAFILFSRDGTILTEKGEAGRTRDRVEVFRDPDPRWVSVDGRLLARDLSGWEIWTAEGEAARKAVREYRYPPQRLTDAFMREDLFEDGLWRPAGGQWSLKQHGGGMPKDEREEENYSFQRAVNPFTVVGSGSGVLSCGDSSWVNYHVEARFYFGVPRTGNVTDTQTVPTDTDMLVIQGEPDGRQVAFGWRGAERRFMLLARNGASPWETLGTWAGSRPPLTNWVKLGLTVRNGFHAEGFLDDVKACEADTDEMVRGPFHVACGAGPMEFDDVAAWTLPDPVSPGAPVYVRSRYFSGKKNKPHSDPEQFEEWARSTDTFIHRARSLPEGGTRTEMITRMPLMGDVLYETIPYRSGEARADNGLYEVSILRPSPSDPMDLSQLVAVFTVRLEKSDAGWRVVAPGAAAGEAPPPPAAAVRLGRLAADDDCMTLRTGGRVERLSPPIHGPIRLSVAHLIPAGQPVAYPEPEQHGLYCSNTVNEFFETAPTDWSWIEGSWRMDMRWACQDRWNFMASGSTGVPMLVSKRAFHGDQEHEYYMSLRPVFPWDAGDKDFYYSPAEDPGFKILVENHSWYNRHDLNFSFCMNGRDPMSGYSIVFGGDDNRETRLLRKGRVVARTDQARFLFPTDPGHHAVHWLWWDFQVRRYGGRIRVTLNDETIFDYDDPQPIEGGHVAYWSVRNGFTLSRVISVAERIDSKPHVLYVPNGGVQPSPWTPMVHDAVQVTRQEGPLDTRVRANVGAGFFAVRWRPQAQVDLAKTPVMELPIRVGQGARVNVYLAVGARSYVIEVNAPLAGCKVLLAPEYETGEQFQIPVLDEAELRRTRLLGRAEPDGVIRIDLGQALDRLGAPDAGRLLSVLTVGNASNEDYLLAGNGGNDAGATFELGTPRFLPR